MKMRVFFILCFCFVSASPVLAADDAHRRLMAHFALAAERQKMKSALPWITRFSFETTANVHEIRLADGEMIYARPAIVSSAYDRSVTYDVSGFYKPSSPRLNAVMNYSGWHAGEIFSFGFDTGFSAEKIRVKPAFFLGYTRAFRLGEMTHLTLGMGSWFGGGVSETPCLDEYDREYWCPALIAWTDYAPPRRRLAQYVNLVLTHRF